MQWLNCWNLKDELDRFHIGGGLSYLLPGVAINFNHTVGNTILYDVKIIPSQNDYIKMYKSTTKSIEI